MIGYTKEQSSKKPFKQKKEKTNRYKCSICGDYYRMTPKQYQLKGSVHSGALKRSCEKEECKRQSILNKAMKQVEKDREERKKKQKDKDQVERHKLGVAKSDTLQTYINQIVKLLDEGQPCLARPNDFNTKMEAGHVFPRSNSAMGIRYNVWNIHMQGNYSNHGQRDDALMREGLVKRHGISRLEYLYEMKKKYPVLKEIDFDRQKAMDNARVIIKELKKGLRLTRDEINERIGIYK